MLVRIAIGLAFIGFIVAYSFASTGCSSCELAQRTALDVGRCAVQGAAEAAVPIIGEVADHLFGVQPQVEMENNLRSIGVRAGVNALGCALDRLIGDLTWTGGPSRPSHGEGPSPRSRALERARLARTNLSS